MTAGDRGAGDPGSDRVADAARHVGLGLLVERFDNPQARRVGFAAGALAALLAGGLLLVAALARPVDASVLPGTLGVFGLVVAVFLGKPAIGMRGRQVAVFDDGLVVVTGGEVTAARWEDVTSLFVEVRRSGLGPTRHRYTAHLHDGRSIRLDNRDHRITQLGERIVHHLVPVQMSQAVAVFVQGQPVTFGPVMVSWQAVATARRSIPWESYGGVMVLNGELVIQPRRGAGLKPIRLPVMYVPNVALLLSLLHWAVETGVAQTRDHLQAGMPGDSEQPDVTAGQDTGSCSPADDIRQELATLPGHFGAVGVAIRTHWPALYAAIDTTEVAQTPQGGRIATWRDASGAAVTFVREPDVQGGQLVCVTPSVVSTTPWTARMLEHITDLQCRFCDAARLALLDADGHEATQVVVRLLGVGTVDRPIPAQGSLVRVRASAFVEGVEEHARSEQELDDRPGERPRLAARCVIPTGLFGGRPTPHAVVGGTVAGVDRRTNTATGRDFVHVLLDSYPGRWELVLRDADTPEGLAAGQVLRCTCWVVAELLPTR